MSENQSLTNSDKVRSNNNEFEEETMGLSMTPPAFALFASSKISNGEEDKEVGPASILQELQIDTDFYHYPEGDEKFNYKVPRYTVIQFLTNDDYDSPRRRIVVVKAKDLRMKDKEGYLIPETNEGISTPEPTETAEISQSLYAHKNLLQQDTNLYAEAKEDSKKSPIKRGTPITLMDDPDEFGWVQVQIEDGKKKRGYIKKTAMLRTGKDIPADTKLHNIQGPKLDKNGEVQKNGETLEGIIKKYYPKRGEYFSDNRTIANLILEFNNSQNRNEGEAIYVANSGDYFEKFWHGVGVNYDDITIRANHDILIPSWDYILAHYDKVQSGSMTEGLVSNFWPDGYGAHFAGSALGGFLVFEGGVDASVYFYRKGSDIIINAQATLKGGAAVGVGAGIHFGKKGKTGLAVAAGAEARAHNQAFGMLELRIPLRAGMMANFISGMIEAGVTLDKDKAAAKFMQTFEGDPLNYLNAFEMGLGIKGQAQASASAGLGKPGSQTQSQDHGGGFASTTTTTTNSERNTRDENIQRQKRSTLFSGIKQLITKGETGALKEHGIWELSNIIREITSLSGNAEAGISGGVEYHKQNGKDQFSVYMKGDLLLELDLPSLRGLSVGGSASVALVFINEGTPQDKSFVFKGAEAKFGKGDMNDPNAAGTEYTMGLDVAEASSFEEVVQNSLASLQIKKRFALNWASRGLRRTLGRVGRVKALMDRDYSKTGINLGVSLTVGLDFGVFNSADSAFQKDLENLKTFLGWNGKNAADVSAKIHTIVESIQNPKKAVGLAARFLELILQPQVLSEFSIHAEAGAGFAAGGNVKAGVEVQLDVSAEGGIIFHHDFAEEIAGFLSDIGTRAEVLAGIHENEAELEKTFDRLSLDKL